MLIIKGHRKLFRCFRAFAVQCRYGLSWWDSLIVAAAEAGGCAKILSEDLSDGADYFGIAVENPFHSPA